MIAAGISGFFLGGSLILAIGAQNAFVLSQGLMRNHVFAICLFCALSDALLIALGVGGFGATVTASPVLLTVATVGGAAFLLVYGVFALRRAMRPSHMIATRTTPPALLPALASCAAFTFLNPHVYLDTVVLVGGLSATWPGDSRYAFGLGAMTASFAWFFSLGYGATLLQGVFANPLAWRVLDGCIALVMWALAAKIAVAML